MNIFLKSKKIVLEKESEKIFLTKVYNTFEKFNFDEYLESLDDSYCSLDDWKKSTQLACWNCSLKFHCVPWFIPFSWTRKVIVGEEIRYKIIHNFPDGVNKQEKKLIKPFGNFCSARCAVRFLNETTEIVESQKPVCLNLLYLLCFEFTGKRISYIEPAPPKHKMIKYCGEKGISEEKYQQIVQAEL